MVPEIKPVKETKVVAKEMKPEPEKTIYQEAQYGLENLKKGDLTELKAFANPPPLVSMVASATLILLKIKSKNPWQAF